MITVYQCFISVKYSVATQNVKFVVPILVKQCHVYIT